MNVDFEDLYNQFTTDEIICSKDDIVSISYPDSPNLCNPYFDALFVCCCLCINTVLGVLLHIEE